MEDRLFIQYLQILAPSSFEEFSALAKARLNPGQQSALEYILKCHSQAVSPLESEIIRQLNLKPTANPKAGLKRFFYNCTECLEDYLILQEVKQKENRLLRSTLLLKRFKKPREASFFKRTLDKVARQLSTENDLGHLLASLLFSHDIFFHPLMDIRQKSATENPVEDLSVFFDLLEKSYWITKNKYQSIALINQKLHLEKTGVQLANETVVDFEVEAHPLVVTYQLFQEIFIEFDEHKYRLFKQIFFENVANNEIGKKEQVTLFRLLINLTARAVREDKKYLEDALEDYSFGIENNLIEQNGVLPPEHFFNYITIACSLGKQGKAKHFLEYSQTKLHSAKRQQAINIGEALILNAEGRYKAAYLTLNQKNFRNPHLRIMARSHRLIACFDWEMSGEELIELDGQPYSIREELRSFQLVLKRLKPTLGAKNERIIANENFRDMTKHLVDAAYSLPTKELKEKLKNKLAKYKLIACRRWLEEKIEAL